MIGEAANVLLIEDNPGDARLIQEMLKEAGKGQFAFQHAMGLDEGIKRCRQEKFDVLLLDLGLPESKGLETLEKAKAQATELPIIILTGLNDEEIGVEAVAKGAQDYLVKGQTNSNLLIRSIRYSVERERAEEHLKESEAGYRLLFESNPHPMWFFDAETLAFLAVNEASIQHYGYSREEFLSMSIKDIRPPEEVRRLLDDIAMKHTGIDFAGQWKHKKKNGAIIDVEITSHDLNYEGRKAKVVLAHDVTERLQAEEQIRKLNKELEQRVLERTAQLEAANEKLQMFVAMAESSFDFVSMATVQGEIFYLNRGGRKLMGLGPDEEPPKPIAAYCEPATWELVQREGIPALLQQGKWEGEGRLRNFRTGELWDAAMRAFMVINPATGEPLCLAAIDSNITERKRAEAEIARRTIELEGANKELEAFSYSVSHDLRAPLRRIDGFSQAVLEDSGHQLNEKAKNYLDRARLASQEMGQLIDDLLRLSRVTRAEMHRTAVDMSAFAERIAFELRKAEPARRADIVITPGLVDEADANLVRVLLENLLGNAWKFTRNTTPARIEFGKQIENGKPVYFVRDNGAGFDSTYGHKLFASFQRLHHTSEFEGTGIGLATVQRIVHRHGGNVRAEGEVNKGATFYFTFTP